MGTMGSIIRHMWRGQTLMRILMNQSFKSISLSGVVVDVGGARNPDYFSYFDMSKVASVEAIDGMISNIDFETDSLPKADAGVDTVVLCNVLEHIFNHLFLLKEIHRTLRDGGKLVGFVPFLINYHPDPHDYFRYTQEALVRLLTQAGFSDVHIVRVGGGPFYVHFNNVMLSVPWYVRPLLFIPYLLLDKLFLVLRPKAAVRYPLGYTFYATKHA